MPWVRPIWFDGVASDMRLSTVATKIVPEKATGKSY
jgi:hypothetical protein